MTEDIPMTDDGITEAMVEAGRKAYHTAYMVKGQSHNDGLLAALQAALAAQKGEGGWEGETLACDVHLPPATYLRKGVSLDAFLVGMRARAKFPAEATVFASPSPATWNEAVEALEAALDEHDGQHGVFKDDFMPNHWTHKARRALTRPDPAPEEK